MKQTTVGDLIAALSQYPVDTPIIGGPMTGEVSAVFSIQEAHIISVPDSNTDGTANPVEDTLLSVSLHVWPATEVEVGTILGEVTPVLEPLPRLVPLDPIPANANPFNHDLYHCGSDLCGPWMAMYSGGHGHKPEYSQTAEEKVSMKPVWHDDPKYIILVNQRTGQRFKMIWDNIDRPDISEAMQELLLRRELGIQDD